ncbi:hypothetical protein [Streptosporangium subroseum]|uniref:hypothetical protein n=1 Tax=Streptosporangium subroseum TaxID=106412 RepID=UPI0030920AF5|nr:hypothetical protein OHB15_26180 [Streptosporangium subroseum]
MRHVIETVILSAIGRVNQMVFWASRGRVVLYRFQGRSGVMLTITETDAPMGKTVIVGYLPDGDDYIVLADDAEADELTALCATTSVSAEFTPGQHVTVDIAVLTDDVERASLLDRLLRHTSLNERHEVVRRREFPVARLIPHHKPGSGASIARASF